MTSKPNNGLSSLQYKSFGVILYDFHKLSERRKLLESMHFDVVFKSDFLLNKKLLNFGSVITLQLDTFPQLVILDNCPIACKNLEIINWDFHRVNNKKNSYLLEGFQKPFLIKLRWQSLNSGQGLSTISLLNSQVYNGRLNSVRFKQGITYGYNFQALSHYRRAHHWY